MPQSAGPAGPRDPSCHPRSSPEHPSWRRVEGGLDAGDVDQQIGQAWIAAQDLRRIYASASPAQAQERLYAWMVHCADSDVPELRRLATTIDSWTAEFLAYFTTGGISNGPTEAMNLLIKKIKPVGRQSHAVVATKAASVCREVCHARV